MQPIHKLLPRSRPVQTPGGFTFEVWPVGSRYPKELPAGLLGLSQPDVSRLLRADFREYSLERLMRLLTALGRDIDIVVRQPRSPEGGGRLRVAASETA